MNASLIIEAIGQNTVSLCTLHRRRMDSIIPGLGELVLGDESQFKRWGVWEITENRARELHARMDYSNANSKGSRGIMACYVLEGGKRYLVKSPVSWRRVDKYVCHVNEAGNIVRE